MQFSIKVDNQRLGVTKEYPIGSFALKNQLNRFYLNEIKNKNRSYQRPPLSADEYLKNGPQKLDEGILREALKEAIGPINEKYNVQLIYREWARLNKKTLPVPDKVYVLENQTIGPQ